VRERIVAACLEVFTEKGFRATTMKAVAERAGISERGLVHHFPNKEELLAAVLRTRDELDEEGKLELGGSLALSAIMDTHYENMRHQTLLELHTVLSAEAVSTDHPGHEYYTDRYAQLRLYLTFAYKTLRETDHVSLPADDSTLAAMTIALMDGLQVQWLYDPGSIDVKHAFDTFFAAIGIEPPATDMGTFEGTREESAL